MKMWIPIKDYCMLSYIMCIIIHGQFFLVKIILCSWKIDLRILVGPFNVLKTLIMAWVLHAISHPFCFWKGDPQESLFLWHHCLQDLVRSLPLSPEMTAHANLCSEATNCPCMLFGCWLSLREPGGVWVSKYCWFSYGVSISFSYFNPSPNSSIGISDLSV